MARLRPGSLRGRLMAGVILLAALGMVVVNVASLTALRIYFTTLADANLARIRDTVRQAEDQTAAVLRSLDAGNSHYVALLDAQGRTLTQIPARGLDGHLVPPPDLPARVPPGFAGTPTNVPAQGTPATTYRLIAFPLDRGVTVPGGAGTPSNRVIIGENLGPSERVVYWLIGVDAVAMLAALAGIALLSRGVLTVGLRPLRNVAGTATAIAEGDLSQRITVTPRHSEIGEVGRALNQAFDARQRSEERLRRFVADASHELRTPLTAIRGWAQLHLHGLAQEPEQVERAMARIDAEAARMHTMVDDLLLLARLDQGRPLATTPVDLGRLAADAVADLRTVALNRPITLDAPDGVFADGDEDRLLQVLQNLLNNALQHTPAATPISVTVRALPGDQVALTISDRGPGMDPQTAARIFERFYRADNSRNLDTGGAGLGLSIVKSIVETHGGTATVRTSPGQGSTFTIALPAAR
ncbi:sensor histidine kinase [Spirillospora sp. CA-255316]